MFVAKRIAIIGRTLFLTLICSAEIIAVRVPVGLNESLWKRRIPRDNPLTPQKIMKSLREESVGSNCSLP